MASGTLQTSILNSAANSVKGRSIFKELANENQPALATKFDSVCAQTVFGDDNVQTFDTQIKPWFNGQTIAQKAYDMFGQVHTAPDKSPDIPLSQRLEDCEYLKRKFELTSSGLVLAPLNEDSLKNMVQWVQRSKKVSVATQMETNIKNAMIEWSLHGRRKYEVTQSVMNAFLRAARCSQHTLSYNEAIQLLLLHKM